MCLILGPFFFLSTSDLFYSEGQSSPGSLHQKLGGVGGLGGEDDGEIVVVPDFARFLCNWKSTYQELSTQLTHHWHLNGSN